MYRTPLRRNPAQITHGNELGLDPQFVSMVNSTYFLGGNPDLGPLNLPESFFDKFRAAKAQGFKGTFQGWLSSLGMGTLDIQKSMQVNAPNIPTTPTTTAIPASSSTPATPATSATSSAGTGPTLADQITSLFGGGAIPAYQQAPEIVTTQTSKAPYILVGLAIVGLVYWRLRKKRHE